MHIDCYEFHDFINSGHNTDIKLVPCFCHNGHIFWKNPYLPVLLTLHLIPCSTNKNAKLH